MRQRTKEVKKSDNLFADFRNKRISLFSDFVCDPDVKSIDVSGTFLKDFKGYTAYDSLISLIANNTKISSFVGALPTLKLCRLSLIGTPLGSARLFALMSVIVFGQNISYVNGRQVSDKTKSKAAQLRPRIRKYLLDGYLLLNTNPLTVLAPNDPTPMILDLTEEEAAEKQKQIEENERKLVQMRKELEMMKKRARKSKGVLKCPAAHSRTEPSTNSIAKNEAEGQRISEIGNVGPLGEDEIEITDEEELEAIPKTYVIPTNDFSDDYTDLAPLPSFPPQIRRFVPHSDSIDRELDAIKKIDVPPTADESGFVHGDQSIDDLSEIIPECPQRTDIMSSDIGLSDEVYE